MYKSYFGFKELPFSIAPNPHFLYMSDRHREALAHLLYGVQGNGGFILLTGEVGTGKTTVCRCLLEQIPENVDTAFILNPKLTVLELMAAICDDLQINYPSDANLKVLIDKLNGFLLESLKNNRQTLLIIDEAQNLSADVLEQLRLLTNLETNQKKLLQIVLIGQPELLDLLSRKELRQLNQRITARFHLDALNRNEVSEYVAHRLGIANGKGDLFTPAAIRRIFRLSKGIPRLINLLCDRALLGAYAENCREVTSSTITRASREIFGRTNKKPRNLLLGATAALAMISVAALSLKYQPVDLENWLGLKGNPVATYSQLAKPGKPEMGAKKLAFNDESLGYTDEKRALLDLFNIWGTPEELINDTNPCLSASRAGLSCLIETGSIRDLLKYNRPAIVDINGEYFTLINASDHSLELHGPTQAYSASISQLEMGTDQTFKLLWRLPPGYEVPILPGDQGAPVDWLTSQMAVINDDELTREVGNSYTESLRKQVEEFQSSHGLVPDGTVDARTWIHINSVQGLGIPFLKTKNV